MTTRFIKAASGECFTTFCLRGLLSSNQNGSQNQNFEITNDTQRSACFLTAKINALPHGQVGDGNRQPSVLLKNTINKLREKEHILSSLHIESTSLIIF